MIHRFSGSTKCYSCHGLATFLKEDHRWLNIFDLLYPQFLWMPKEPKHLLGQNVPLEGKVGEFLNFPSEESFSLENSFPFPLKWPVLT